MKQLNIDLSESFAIGDKIRDCSICNTTLCRGYLIGQNEEPDIIQKVKDKQIKNIQYAVDLNESAHKISQIIRSNLTIS